jgi:hypothetical protein
MNPVCNMIRLAQLLKRAASPKNYMAGHPDDRISTSAIDIEKMQR